MTGTAETELTEFDKIYDLSVPKSCRRTDRFREKTRRMSSFAQKAANGTP